MVSSNVVLTPDHLERVVEHFMDYGAFAFDVEAVGTYRSVPTQNTVTWLSLATTGMGAVIPFGHPNGDRLITAATKKKNPITKKFDMFPAVYEEPPEQMRPSEVFSILKPLFFSDRIKVAHNATYDLISTAKYFGEIAPPEYADTIVLQWLLDENTPQKGLKELVKRYYHVDYDTENVGKRVEIHPFSKVAHYSYMDAKYTWLLWQKLNVQIEAQGLSRMRDLEMDVLGVLLDMGVEGAPVDVEAMRALEVEFTKDLVDIEGRVYKAAGRIFNINSVPQKAKMLWGPRSEGGQGLRPFKPTKGGKKREALGLDMEYNDYSTDAESLEMHPNNPLCTALLEYQEVNRLLTGYVQGYLGVDGDPKRPSIIFADRIYADLVQYGTVSGRFSCRAPNLQNVPRPDSAMGRKVRGLFVAPFGQQFIVVDYSAIEMVVLAHYLGHGRLFDDTVAGIDPHTATAAAIFNVDPTEVEPSMRFMAKGINFAVIYGAGVSKVASMAETSYNDAKRFLNIHARQFPEIYAFKNGVIQTARSRRPPHIKTILGRYRRVPALNSSDQGIRAYTERQTVNSLIQGSAADLIKLAMIRLSNTSPDWMHLILSVHDELVSLVPEEYQDEGAKIVHEAMLGEGIARLLRVPMKADIKIVKNWGEAK